jgi:phosphate/sulfate permease
MQFDIYAIALIVLASIAVLDLIVGVSNDAVNFLNSSIGSRVAPRHIILIIASFGIIAGVLFSSGMMEVARKGIFHPQLFTMPELITLFLAVMLADVLVLDLFNTYGMPTSTTVSIVFELLGAAVALSLLKIISNGDSLATLDQYINSGKALTIIGGILLSVVIAFSCGALVQFCGRLVFTFDYERNLKKYGGVWGGLSMAAIALFILLKGAKGATFITPEASNYIKSNLGILFILCWLVSGTFFQILVSIFKVNILKPIVLIGTFSLALAFAANDLVNFVGVPIAGFHAYQAAQMGSDPLTMTMGGLAGKVPTSNFLLFLCGAIMVAALWFSKKARSVTKTEVGLGSHDEENEQFGSIALSRAIVRLFLSASNTLLFCTPRSIHKHVNRRFKRTYLEEHNDYGTAPSFDLLRASTNLMVASVVISFATSLKLPLSTTYVTFMVAMGSSLSDRAWGSETAVFRITGVLTVIGGWFMTAIMASFTAGLFCTVIYFGQEFGVLALLAALGFILWKTHHTHKERENNQSQEYVYNLKKISDAPAAVKTTFQQSSYFIGQLRENFNTTLTYLFAENRLALKLKHREVRKLHNWSGIISANVFKSMRLIHRSEVAEQSEYAMTVVCLQHLAESYSDISQRSYFHVRQSHKGLLDIQRKELSEVGIKLQEILTDLEGHLNGSCSTTLEELQAKYSAMSALVAKFNALQSERIHECSSKTRLSILYYALMGNMLRIGRRSLKLFKIYQTSLAMVREQALSPTDSATIEDVPDYNC